MGKVRIKNKLGKYIDGYGLKDTFIMEQYKMRFKEELDSQKLRKLKNNTLQIKLVDVMRLSIILKLDDFRDLIVIENQ